MREMANGYYSTVVKTINSTTCIGGDPAEDKTDVYELNSSTRKYKSWGADFPSCSTNYLLTPKDPQSESSSHFHDFFLQMSGFEILQTQIVSHLYDMWYVAKFNLFAELFLFLLWMRDLFISSHVFLTSGRDSMEA